MNAVKLFLFGAILGLLLGLGGGAYLTRKGLQQGPVAATDAPQPSIKLPSGAVIGQVAPVKVVPRAPGLPPSLTPLRHVEIDVAVPPPTGPVFEDGVVTEKQPVKVFLDLTRQPDGHLRVVAYAEGGEVVGVVDAPLETVTITAPSAPVKLYNPHWTVLAERVVPLDRVIAPTWGVAVQYAKGPFVGGLGGNRYELRASLGFRF